VLIFVYIYIVHIYILFMQHPAFCCILYDDIQAALCDDFDTPTAIKALLDLIKCVHKYIYEKVLFQKCTSYIYIMNIYYTIAQITYGQYQSLVHHLYMCSLSTNMLHCVYLLSVLQLLMTDDLYDQNDAGVKCQPISVRTTADYVTKMFKVCEIDCQYYLLSADNNVICEQFSCAYMHIHHCHSATVHYARHGYK
jgi:hypothetical protein